MFRTTFFGKTDVGLKRGNNEDTFFVSPERMFCLVADGMGGAAAGELASRIFAETSMAVFPEPGDRSKKEIPDLVKTSFSHANQKILDHVKENIHHKGMGCTAELIAFSDEGFVLGHIGDSRTYRLRAGQLKQLTQDHSVVQDQVNRGLITPAEARNHRLRNVILRAVGVNDSLALDLLTGKTFSGDLFLLCSDGLTDMVEDTLLHQVLCSEMPLPQKVDELIKSAKSAGGNDNITVVLSEIA